jgi:hypothetical protein
LLAVSSICVDWKWTITAVLPVISLVLGAWLTQLSEGRRESAALQREQKVRELDRDQAAIERRETFEITHLTGVNEALSEVFAGALECYTRIEANESSTAASAQLMAANRRMSSVKGLILDDNIRALVSDAHERCNRVSGGPRPEAPYTAVAETYLQVEAAQAAIAARIRQIYKTDTGSTPANAS